VTQTSSNTLFSVDNQSLSRSVSRDTSAGAHLNLVITESKTWRTSWSLGLDYKDHATISLATNTTILTVHSEGTDQQPVDKVTRFDIFQGSAQSAVSYIPFQVGWNSTEMDKEGQTSAGATCVFSPGGVLSGTVDFQESTFSSKADGHFAAFRLRLSRDQQLIGKWRLNVGGEAQLATQPLVSVEQFGIGGMGSVRGYQEGELYGDNGWYTQVELRAPVISPKEMFDGKPVDLGINFSAFTDYGQVFLIDPHGRPPSSDLWGAGFAGSMWLGPQLSGRVAVAWPLLNSPSRAAGTVRFTFGISAQF
jgi:hemolysin activation/secretion protein